MGHLHQARLSGYVRNQFLCQTHRLKGKGLSQIDVDRMG